MQYHTIVTCKLCHTKVTKDNPVCDCGNVAISRISKLPHGLVVFVDNLRTVQFSKVYYTVGSLNVKVEIPLQQKYQWNWSIVEDITIYSKFSHWLMPITPVFIFSGAKFLHYFKRWVRWGFKWFKNNKYNSFEEVYEKRGSETPF